MCICDYKIIFVIEKMRVGQANHMKSEIKTAGPYSRRENTDICTKWMYVHVACKYFRPLFLNDSTVRWEISVLFDSVL